MTQGRPITWWRTLLVIGLGLAMYVATALIVGAASGDAVIGAAASNIAAAIFALVYRRRSSGTFRAAVLPAPARRGSFWLAAGLALVAAWFAGQTASVWLYGVFGSPGFDATVSARGDTGLVLLVVTTLLLAPLGEEALLRGTAFQALRQHWSPLAAAFATSAVFALLHGNLVQIAVTLPLGMVLAFVYESTRRLWPIVVMHVLFNVASTVAPVDMIVGLANPIMATTFVLATAVLLFALAPSRFASDGEQSPPSAELQR